MPPRRVVRSGSKPRYVWLPARDNENAVASATVQSSDLLAAYIGDAGRNTGPGMVLERVLGSLTVESQTTGTGGDFTMGIIVAPEGGFGAIPSPSAEINDYLVWISGRFPSGANEQAAGVFQPDQMTYQFDVRSRRRLRSIGDGCFGIVQNLNSTSMLWTLNTRILMRVT